ncbi:hypothetical protein CVT27_16010 [Streptomyces cavourensis]|nr:hypothetical protein CVT27_16010 [Streptomyces cavourensis]
MVVEVRGLSAGGGRRGAGAVGAAEPAGRDRPRVIGRGGRTFGRGLALRDVRDVGDFRGVQSCHARPGPPVEYAVEVRVLVRAGFSLRYGPLFRSALGAAPAVRSAGFRSGGAG